MHLTRDQFLAALLGRLPFLLLHRQVHRHLLETCGRCRAAWRKARPRKAVPAAARPELPVPPPLPADPRAIAPETLTAVERLLSESREAVRRSREDLGRMLRLPPERWHEPGERSRTRFRSCAFAELLIEESRRRVRTSAPEAAKLAAMVPAVLDRREGREDKRWARVLLARAAAHRANALRVAGDLPAADSAFAELRRRPELNMDLDPPAVAEISSLEASLRIGQRQFQHAEALLQQAAAMYRRLEDASQLGRTLIKQANLLRTVGQPGAMLTRLEEAAGLINPETEPYLYFCTVHGRINALLDLDRPREAGDLLAAEGGVYLDGGDDYTEALHGFMQARVDLGLGRLAAAEAGFATARDRLLALDRDYDAVLACLYLADALLAAGKTAALRDLAAGLVPLFAARGVERETLASLRLLAEAARAETLNAAVVATVRRRLGQGSRDEPAGDASQR